MNFNLAFVWKIQRFWGNKFSFKFKIKLLLVYHKIKLSTATELENAKIIIENIRKYLKNL